MDLKATGPFSVKASFEPPLHEDSGVVLGRAHFDKQFSGQLSGTSFVEMLYVRTPDPETASYVAIERIDGVLCGLKGSFVVTHVANKDPRNSTLDLTIVPGTGTGALTGLLGTMEIINQAGGSHRYKLAATLPDLK